MMDDDIIDATPQFYEKLSSDDKLKYDEMKNILGSPDHRYNRNKRIVTFNEMLDTIKEYCVKEDIDDWKRFLVCGICWMNNEIAINTRQLRILLGKSKSSINGAFAKMGYETIPSKGNDTEPLIQKIPFLKGNFSEFRQWTVRRPSSGIAKSPRPVLKTDLVSATPIMPTFQGKKQTYSISQFPSPLPVQAKEETLQFDYPPMSQEYQVDEYFDNWYGNNDDPFSEGPFF